MSTWANWTNIWLRNREYEKYVYTDYDGFVSILDNIKQMEGKLVFLTARRGDSENWTKKQLKQIGINPEDFEIH